MTKDAFDAIFSNTSMGGAAGKVTPAKNPAPALLDAHQQALAGFIDEMREPEYYRPYIIRPISLGGFGALTKDGRARGFQYHTLRLPDFQPGPPGGEILTYVADNMAVTMQGTGLKLIWRALVRHTLFELRENDGLPVTEQSHPLGFVDILRLEIIDPSEQENEKERIAAQAGDKVLPFHRKPIEPA